MYARITGFLLAKIKRSRWIRWCLQRWLARCCPWRRLPVPCPRGELQDSILCKHCERNRCRKALFFSLECVTIEMFTHEDRARD